MALVDARCANEDVGIRRRNCLQPPAARSRGGQREIRGEGPNDGAGSCDPQELSRTGMSQCRSILLQVPQSHREIVMRLSPVGSQPDGSFKPGHCRRVISHQVEGIAQIVVLLRIAGDHFPGPAIVQWRYQVAPQFAVSQVRESRHRDLGCEQRLNRSITNVITGQQ
jgi:hypothetical protein